MHNQEIAICLRLRCNEYIRRKNEFTQQPKACDKTHARRPRHSRIEFENCRRAFSKSCGVRKLRQLGLKPGTSMFFAGVNITKRNGFDQFNVACKWSRNYHQAQMKEGWFLLTNLSTLQVAIATYQQRSGIECMFKDYKTGGDNLEGCYVIEARLSVIVLLIEDCLYQRNYSRYKY